MARKCLAGDRRPPATLRANERSATVCGQLHARCPSSARQTSPSSRYRPSSERANKAVLRKKNIKTIPRDVAERMHLEEGDEFIVTEEGGLIVFTPALSIPADQVWFW